MDRFTRVLAGLLGRSARLLPAARRDWAEAVLAEAGEIPARGRRVAWLAGGLRLVAREVLMRTMRVLAFAAGATVLVRVGWPGSSSDSAVPLNRMYVVVTVVLLAVLPAMVRRYFGSARPGWGPRAARVSGYAMVLALIAAKTVKDRLGSKLGAYFVVVPGLWVMEVLLLLIIAGYVAGLLILTSQRVRLTRWTLPIVIGLGAVTGGGLYALAPLPHHVPLQSSSYTSHGGCETCDPDRTMIPPGLRHEYLAEISVGQSGQTPLTALMIAPFLGAWLGVLGGGLGRRSLGTGRRSGGPEALPPPPPHGSLLASDDDLDRVIDTLTTAFAQGRLTSQELDLRTGQALAARAGSRGHDAHHLASAAPPPAGRDERDGRERHRPDPIAQGQRREVRQPLHLTLRQAIKASAKIIEESGD